MKINSTFIVFVLLLLTGCGDLGSSSSTTNVTQAQDNTQVQTDPTLNCSTSCTFIAQTGEIIAQRECEGAATITTNVGSLDECDSVSELAEIALETDESSPDS